MLHYGGQQRSFRISEKLDYETVIELDKRQHLTFSPLYPAVVQLHEEMPAQDVPLHWHRGIEFVYVRQGAVRLLIDGYATLISDGQLCLVGPNSYHAIYPCPPGNAQSVLSVTFDDRRMGVLCPELRDRPIMQSLPLGRGTAQEDEAFRELCEELVGFMDETASPLRYLDVNRLLLEIFKHVYTTYGVKTSSAQAISEDDAVDGRVKPIIDFIDSHFNDNITVQDVARRFGYSREHFSRIFKIHAGLTPEQYLTEIRLRSAVDYLLTTNDRITQVAQVSGFPSVKSFNRCFKQRYGSSPMAFRQAYHEWRPAADRS